MSDTNNQTAAVSVGVLDLLGVVFVTLKLLGKISWSWWAVTAPFWAPFVVIFGIIAVILLVAGIAWLLTKPGRYGVGRVSRFG